MVLPKRSRYLPKINETRTRDCKTCNSIFLKPQSVSLTQWGKRNYCSLSCSMKGKKHALGGRHHLSNETRQKQSKAKKAHTNVMFGENNPAWKGGITSINKKQRTCAEAIEWRKKVFERDNFTCQRCKRPKCYLEAHHIKSFADFPELRFEITNGITLCRPCHGTVNKHRARFIFIKIFSLKYDRRQNS